MKFERRRTLEAGVFIGAMVLIIIYNLVLGFRQSSLFLIHAIFSTTILFLFTRPNGLTFEYLWPNTGALDATSGPIVASISMLTALLFLIHYFNLEKMAPRLSVFLKACGALPLLVVVLLHLLPHQVIASSLAKILAVEVLIWMGVTLWAIQKRMDGAMEYAANWGLVIICGVVYASWLQGYSSNFYAAGYLIKLSAIVQAAGLSYSARRRIQRSQELSLETRQAIETVRKIQQVNQLNDLLHSLGHELANPIGVVQLAHEEIQTRLRKVHRLNQAIHGQATDNEDVSRLYKEIDTLYGLQEASQQAAHRLGALRAVLDTQLKLHENKSLSLCINQIINDAVIIAASHTQNVALTTSLAQNLPIIAGYQSHLTHIVIYLLKDAANRIDCTLATTAGESSEHFIRIETTAATHQGARGIEIHIRDSSDQTPGFAQGEASSPSNQWTDDALLLELNEVLSKFILDSHGGSYRSFQNENIGQTHQIVFLPFDGGSTTTYLPRF